MYSLNAQLSSTALPSFSHDQHHKTDAAKQKGGGAYGLNFLPDAHQSKYTLGFTSSAKTTTPEGKVTARKCPT